MKCFRISRIGKSKAIQNSLLMIIPTTLDGKPFEGMALVLLAMQIISLRIELRGTEGDGLIGSFFAFLLSSIPFVLLGMQKIAELKTYLLVGSVLSAIICLGYIVMQDTTGAFRVAIGLGVCIAAYFLIDTQYDTAVWVFFASNLFSLMYALFVVGPAKSSYRATEQARARERARLLEMVNPALVNKFREEIEGIPAISGMTSSDKAKYIKYHLEKVADMSKNEGEAHLQKLIKIVNEGRDAANKQDDASRKQGATQRDYQLLASAVRRR